jgi:hypothetical protein
MHRLTILDLIRMEGREPGGALTKRQKRKKKPASVPLSIPAMALPAHFNCRCTVDIESIEEVDR